MSLNFDGTDIKEIKYNGTDLIYYDYNGVRVWSKERTLSLSRGSYIKSVSGSGTYVSGQQVTVYAYPNDTTTDYYYYFDGWYLNGVKVSSNATYTFTITENTTLEARGTASYRWKDWSYSDIYNPGGYPADLHFDYGVPSNVRVTRAYVRARCYCHVDFETAGGRSYIEGYNGYGWVRLAEGNQVNSSDGWSAYSTCSVALSNQYSSYRFGMGGNSFEKEVYGELGGEQLK